MHLSPVLQRILSNLQLGPMRSTDLELAVYGPNGPEWSANNLRAHIVRLNRHLKETGWRVVSDQRGGPTRIRSHKKTGPRQRGTYRLAPVRPTQPLVHKQFDPWGVYVG